MFPSFWVIEVFKETIYRGRGRAGETRDDEAPRAGHSYFPGLCGASRGREMERAADRGCHCPREMCSTSRDPL